MEHCPYLDRGHVRVFKRLLMRMIVGFTGGDTDTTRDYEYTDRDSLNASRMLLLSAPNKRKRYLLLRVDEVFS